MTELEELEFLEHRRDFFWTCYKSEKDGSPEKPLIYHLYLDSKQKLEYLNKKQKNKVKTVFLDGFRRILIMKEKERDNSADDPQRSSQLTRDIYLIRDFIYRTEEGWDPYNRLSADLKAMMSKDFEELISRLRKPKW